MNILYLAGFMGSGKSTVGPIVAAHLGWSFVDLDLLIEKKTEKSISTLFLEKSEADFRSLESVTLVEVAQRKNQVVALGGGSLLQEENLRIVNETGIVIYLKCTLETVLLRLNGDFSNRPLLKGNLPEVMSKMKSLFQQREVNYNRIKISINTDNLRPEEISKILFNQLSSKVDTSYDGSA